jgi:hypothetical protein
VKKHSQSFDQIYKNTCKKNIDFVNLVMQHIQGISRQQLQGVPLEDSISQDNPVRFIDAFVHSIHLERIGDKPRCKGYDCLIN